MPVHRPHPGAGRGHGGAGAEPCLRSAFLKGAAHSRRGRRLPSSHPALSLSGPSLGDQAPSAQEPAT